MDREERCEIRFSFLGWTKEGKIIRSPIEIRDSCETRSRQSRYLFLRVAADVSNGGRAIFTSRPVDRCTTSRACVSTRWGTNGDEAFSIWRSSR